MTDRRRMKRLDGILPIKLRSEKTMQSKPGGKSGEREGERWRYSLRQWNDQTDDGARAKELRAPRAKHIAPSKLKNTNVTAVERQKTGEIKRVSSAKSQKLGQKKKRSCTTHCSLVIKIKEERKEREKKEEERNKKMEEREKVEGKE